MITALVPIPAGLRPGDALTAEILAYSRSRGIFAGVSLEGATLRQDASVNKKLYGQAYSNKDIINMNMAPPAQAERLDRVAVIVKSGVDASPRSCTITRRGNEHAAGRRSRPVRSTPPALPVAPQRS